MTAAGRLLGVAVALALTAYLVGRDGGQTGDLVVHEWGTFTSVAGSDGSAVPWAPLSGTPDLPCFVDQLSSQNSKLALGFVRMETPVIYFYSARPLVASVQVRFPEGWLTEWFPQAARVKPQRPKPGTPSQFGGGLIGWDNIRVNSSRVDSSGASSSDNASLPSSTGPSRYYAARNTDSGIIATGSDTEKFLFYRGVGNFRVRVAPRFDQPGKMEIRNRGSDAIPMAVVFENRKGKIGYQFVHSIPATAEVNLPELTGSLVELQHLLVESLVEFGLYRKEAEAMLDTWKDSWFDEGTRVFYITPRRMVDSVLPLVVTPHAATLSRIFVGRVEVQAPWTQQAIAAALENGDVDTLARFDRFLDPFLEQLGFTEPERWSQAAQRYVDAAHVRMARSRASESCVK